MNPMPVPKRLVPKDYHIVEYAGIAFTRHDLLSPHSASPWGKIQTFETLAPGIIVVSTASHGGIWLSEDRIAKMPPGYQWTIPGQGWYEEDLEVYCVFDMFAEELHGKYAKQFPTPEDLRIYARTHLKEGGRTRESYDPKGDNRK